MSAGRASAAHPIDVSITAITPYVETTYAVGTKAVPNTLGDIGKGTFVQVGENVTMRSGERAVRRVGASQ